MEAIMFKKIKKLDLSAAKAIKGGAKNECTPCIDRCNGWCDCMDGSVNYAVYYSSILGSRASTTKEGQ